MTSVGFASSANQAKAASAKKQRKADAIPTTPGIQQAKAKIRANGKAAVRNGTEGKQVSQPDPNIEDVKECWREIVSEMKLVIRDMRARKLAEGGPKVQPARERVVLETIVQVVEEVEPVKPSPLPEKVAIVDLEPESVATVEPLLLPAVCEDTRQARRISRMLQATCQKSGDVLELYANEADMRRAWVRQRWALEMYDEGRLTVEDWGPHPAPAPKPIEFKHAQGHQYVGRYYGSSWGYNLKR